MSPKDKLIYSRWYAEPLRQKLRRPYVHLLFGARQTGKSTLLTALLPPETVRIDLADPAERSRYAANPHEFIQMCRSLSRTQKPQTVFVDEAQTVPTIFDAVQSLYDREKTRWRFVLCGSSARKLRLTGANLLPGRSMIHHLYPLTLTEHPAHEVCPAPAVSPLAFSWPKGFAPANVFPTIDLMTRLAYGELPAQGWACCTT